MHTNAPPPGWYHDGYGLRWWDGAAWGPAAPPAHWIPPDSPEAGKGWAIAAHLGQFAGGFILPLVVYLVERDKNPFARRHAAEALNFQLTVMLAWVAAIIAFITSINVTISETPTDSASPWPIFVVFPLFFAIMILGMVCSILGAVRAGQLREFRYPIRIPFVR